MANLAFIVMPPGHGKSHLHQMLPYLFEADGLVDCKATESLRVERKLAKTTGEWGVYNTLWCSALMQALPDGPTVLLVPERNIGDIIGGIYLGSHALHFKAWAANLEGRKGSIKEYLDIWALAVNDNGKLHTSNSDLMTSVIEQATEWYNSF
jgi:hypothetical protein